MGPANLYLLAASGTGMMLIGVAAVAYCSYRLRPAGYWYAVGAALWVVAVVPKIVSAVLLNPLLIPALNKSLPHAAYVALGSLYIGIQSSVFEMGMTLGAVLIWRQLARDAATGLAIGTGVGAFEAILLGVGSAAGGIAAIAGAPNTEAVGEQVAQFAATTPLFFLVASVERILAILCHVSSRALIFVGVAGKRPMLVVYGVAIFTAIDSIAGAAHLSGAVKNVSMWWIELALVPFAMISVPIIRWCYRNWPSSSPAIAVPPQLP